MKNKEKIRVLFICMGNICRSPTAEAVFRDYVACAGLSDKIEIDSAGTHPHHVGEPPDLRTQRAAKQRGFDLSAVRGRQVSAADFARFDYVLAMDEANLALLNPLTPVNCSTRAELFLNYAHHHTEREVPDPYYGGAEGFERVLDMVEDAAAGLLQAIRQQHDLLR